MRFAIVFHGQCTPDNTWDTGHIDSPGFFVFVLRFLTYSVVFGCSSDDEAAEATAAFAIDADDVGYRGLYAFLLQWKYHSDDVRSGM